MNTLWPGCRHHGDNEKSPRVFIIWEVAVQWLGLSAVTAMAQVQLLVRAPRSRKPCDEAKTKNQTNKNTKANQNSHLGKETLKKKERKRLCQEHSKSVVLNQRDFCPTFRVHLAISKDIFHWKRPWCWEGLGAGGEADDRGWDGWMASLTRWTWVWVNSGSWWWTGRPGMLRFMGSQRVGHDWATELNWKTFWVVTTGGCYWQTVDKGPGSS